MVFRARTALVDVDIGLPHLCRRTTLIFLISPTGLERFSCFGFTKGTAHMTHAAYDGGMIYSAAISRRRDPTGGVSKQIILLRASDIRTRRKAPTIV